MKHSYLIGLLAALLCALECHATELKVLQVNIWQETTMVEGGFDGLADEIARLEPDIVMLCEIRDYKGVKFMPRLLDALRSRGKNYSGGTEGMSVGVLTKHEIVEMGRNCPEAPDAGAVLKARIRVDGHTVVVYSAHLDYTHYACYLPRAYDGVTWKKMEAPVTDVQEIERMNHASMRDEAIGHVIADAKRERGNIVLLGGDFNEPSHLDWGTDTKDRWDHRGAVVGWDCSVMLAQAGFKDSYRTKYPNPLTHPGFTYPANNPDASLEKLDWVPDADGRDRIDFIYYLPTKGLKLKKVSVVGPAGSIAYNKRVGEPAKDKMIEPKSVWPSDHKGVLATFIVK